MKKNFRKKPIEDDDEVKNESEDERRVKYVEKELAKTKGKNIDAANEVENDLKNAEDELYRIPEHLKVKQRNSNDSATQWTSGIAEIRLPIEYMLKISKTRRQPRSFSKIRGSQAARRQTLDSLQVSVQIILSVERSMRDQSQQQRNKGPQENGDGAKPADGGKDGTERREAATDELILERFRKRERHRGMRR